MDRGSAHFFVVEDFTQKPVYSFAVTTGGDKIDSAAPAVDGLYARYAQRAIDLHVGFIHATGKDRKGLRQYQRSRFHFRRITLNPQR